LEFQKSATRRDSVGLNNQPLVAGSVFFVTPGLSLTRGDRLRSPGATIVHRFAVPKPHALPKPAELNAFNGLHQLNAGKLVLLA